MRGRVAFVPLRYGPEIVGGSEAVVREAALGLAERDWGVDILTGRFTDHQTLEDHLPEGESTQDGLNVRRFTSLHHRSRCGLAAQRQIENGVLPDDDDQWTWVSWRFTMPDLFHYLLGHGAGYDAVVFSPYLFWNATGCLSATAANAVIMPCLHDETYARLQVVRPVLTEARSAWFLSEPEHQLAHRLGPVTDHHVVTGAGLHVPGGYDGDRFRAKFGVERRFFLFAGRREKDKGWSWLLDAFAEAIRGGLEGVDLVTIGSGQVEPPAEIASRVIDLGFVSEQDRNDAFAAAMALVQPSRMESFSRSVMEAWLAGIPVLAVADGEVVAWHSQRSGGGLLFASGGELADQLSHLRDHPGDGVRLGAAGRAYVLSEYSWPVVLDRMEADLDWVAGRAA